MVALLETDHLLAFTALSGYLVPAVAHNSKEWLRPGSGSASGFYFAGVALAVDSTCVEFLRFETSLCFVAGVLCILGVGDLVVVAVYIPPHKSRHAPGKYCELLDLLSETASRL